MKEATHDFSKYVRAHPDFPKKGVIYRDFSPLLEDPGAFREAVEVFCETCRQAGAQRIAAIESKGFIIGSAISLTLSLPLILVRKPGLTPGQICSRDFEKEYGRAEYILKKGAVKPGEKVAVIYDILAGPGASLAARWLLEQQGAEAVAFCYVTELEALDGREALGVRHVTSLVKVQREWADAAGTD